MDKVQEENQTNIVLVFGQLLPSILSHVTTSQLLKLRLVNRSWDEEARRLLNRRNDLFTTFQFHRYPNSYADPPTYVRFLRLCYTYGQSNFDDQDDDTTTIEEFTKMLMANNTSNSNSSCSVPPAAGPLFGPFFVSRFRFYNRYGVLELPQVFDFFQVWGVHIKELDIQDPANYVLGLHGWNLDYCILTHTPNLERLTVRLSNGVSNDHYHKFRKPFRAKNHDDDQDNNHGRSNRIPRFHHLKVLELQSCDGIITAQVLSAKLTPLLTIANQLQIVHWSAPLGESQFPFSIVSTLSDRHMDKLHLLRLDELHLDMGKLLRDRAEIYDTLDKLSHCAGAGTLMLKRMRISADCPIAVEVLCRFRGNRSAAVNSNSNTAVVAIWRRALLCLLQLFINVQNTLQTLQIEGTALKLWANKYFLALLPKFPRVSEIILGWTVESYEVFDEDYNYSFFPDQALEILKKTPSFSTSFLSSEDLEAMEKYSIATAFPALKTVTIAWEKRPRQRDPSWLFPFWDKIFPTVTSLYLNLPHESMSDVGPKLGVMFPALKVLQLHIRAAQFTKHCGDLSKFAGLVHLSLCLCPDYSSTGESLEGQQVMLFSLVRALLGITWTTVWHTWEEWNVKGTFKIPMDPYYFLDHPSLLNLRHLEILELKSTYFYDRPRAFLSKLVGQLAVDKGLEGLQVRFTARRHARNVEIGSFARQLD